MFSILILNFESVRRLEFMGREEKLEDADDALSELEYELDNLKVRPLHNLPKFVPGYFMANARWMSFLHGAIFLYN